MIISIKILLKIIKMKGKIEQYRLKSYLNSNQELKTKNKTKILIKSKKKKIILLMKMISNYLKKILN